MATLFVLGMRVVVEDGTDYRKGSWAQGGRPRRCGRRYLLPTPRFRQ